ncbi:hypothetical protein V6N12_002042 [Hibiscus sabdariffa]|uniref:Uncharacterized protein n=1 Tax=Hibiscus sabdariffa TaxID=183260 RepID=A0ABR2B7S4_9ROSI
MDDVFAGTYPRGSDLQAFVIEFIITFYLMFIISYKSIDEPSKELRAGNMRYTDKPLQEINKSASFLKGSCNSG